MDRYPVTLLKGDYKRADRRFVYFIEAVGLGLVKIGVANSVRERLATLTKMSPASLRLLAKAETDRLGALEKELHIRFAEHRSHGEWFRAAPEITDYIAALEGADTTGHTGKPYGG